MQEFLAKDINALSKEEIDRIASLKDKLAQNLQILEKNLTALAENMNAILADFNKTIKLFNSAKEEFALCKQSYDNDAKDVEAKKGQINVKLNVIAKEIDPAIMDAYQKRRKEGVFPVVVPLMEEGKGNYFCGGCRTQLPFASINKINDKGYVNCDHCRRIIYKTK